MMCSCPTSDDVGTTAAAATASSSRGGRGQSRGSGRDVSAVKPVGCDGAADCGDCSKDLAHE